MQKYMRHLVLIIIVTFLVVLFSRELGDLLDLIHKNIHQDYSLAVDLFGFSSLGNIIHRIAVLILYPVILASIPAAFYWLIKKQKMPYLYHCIWFAWLAFAPIVFITN